MKKLSTIFLFQISLTIIISTLAIGVKAQCPAPPANFWSLPYTTSFETGFDANWNLIEQSGSEIDTFSAFIGTAWGNAIPFTGSLMMGLHQPTGGTYAQNEAWLQLDLCGEASVYCSFKWMEWNDETEVQDGVFFSDNGGTNFTKVLDLNGASYTDLQWQSFTLNVDSLCNVYSLNLTEQFVIKFQQYDNYYFNGGNDGHFYDDINVFSTVISDTNTALTAIILPGDSVCDNSNDTMRVVVKNVGGNTLSNIPVEYAINAGSFIFAGNIAGPLANGQSDTLEITGLPFTSAGSYSLQARTVMPGDSDLTNDLLTAEIVNFDSPALPPSSGDTICFGQTLELNSSASPGAYIRWFNASGTTLLDTGNTFHPNSSLFGATIYSLDAFDGFCSSQSNQAVAIVSPPFSDNSNFSGEMTKCLPTILNLNVSSSYSSYNWNTGDTTASISTSTVGFYYVTLTNAMGCIGYSDTLALSNYPATPVPNISVAPSDSVCEGDSVVLTSSQTGNLTWNDANGSSTTSITVSEAGSYAVTLTDANGCTAESQPQPVGFFQLPVIEFSESFPTQYCSDANALNLSPLVTPSGGTWSGLGVAGSLFDPLQTLMHTLTYTVTDENNCSASDSRNINVIDCSVGITSFSEGNQVRIWPVPAKSDLTIAYKFEGETVQLTVIDLAGNLATGEKTVSGSGQTNLDISNLASGSYLLRMESNGDFKVLPFIKE